MGPTTTMWPRTWPEIGHFMRHHGVRWFYPAYLLMFASAYVQLMTVDPEAYPDAQFTTFQTLQIYVIRTVGIIMFPPACLLAVWYFWIRLPVDELNPDEEFKTFPVDSLSVKSPLPNRPHVPGVICFIVTRGEYPNMIRKNVTYHLTMLERYLQCDRLEAHVVTERPLDGDYKVGSGWVREIVVPSNFKTPNGTLFRARNVVYWLENGPAGPDYPPEHDTWLLVLDEDVFVTEGFVREFAYKFLPSGADTSLALPLAFFDKNASHSSMLSEAFTTVVASAFAWLELDILKTQPVWFRGSCYVIRRDLDRKIGRDFGPLLCVSDDHVFGNFCAARKAKFRLLYGWTYEGAAVSHWDSVKQRARWARGNLLAMLHQNLPVSRKINITVRYTFFHFIFTLGMIPPVIGFFQFVYTLLFDGANINMLALGTRVWYLDYIVGFSVSTWNWGVVYGAWLMLPSKQAMFYTVGVYLYVVSLWGYFQHLMGFIWLVVSFVTDLFRGTQRLEVTPKKDE